jgi:hypothetical protein
MVNYSIVWLCDIISSYLKYRIKLFIDVSNTRIQKVRPLFLALIFTIIGGLFTVMIVQQSTWALSNGLTVRVHLLAKKVGIGNVKVEIKGPFTTGPFKYDTYRWVNLQNLIDKYYYNKLGDVYVEFLSPPGTIPDGYHYTVCEGDNFISYFIPHCTYTINHQGSQIENVYFNVWG